MHELRGNRGTISEEQTKMISITIFAVLLAVLCPTHAFSTAAPIGHSSSLVAIGLKRRNSQILHASPKIDEPVQNGPDLSVTKKSQLVPGIALVTLLGCVVAAKVGLLPGEPLIDGGFGPYTDSMIGRDVGSAVLTGGLGYIFVKANTWLAETGRVDPRDSRKIIHCLSAPLFILFWPIFSAAEGARFFAASVSFVNALRLFIAGSGGDKSLAFAVSRSGDQREALGGPFLYVIILFFSIVCFWRDGPIGIIALSAMAAGDGLADLVGRRYGKGNKWWFNQDKSIAGSAAFWLGATGCALVLLNVLSVDLQPTVPLSPELLVTGIMAATALLEVAPIKFDDNYLVPLSAAAFAAIAFA